METLTIKAFRAIDEPELCAEFMRGHKKVLEDFGISNVTTNTATWTTDPDTYVIVAISSAHGMVGGIRVEVDNEVRRLPIHHALVKMDPGIHMALEELKYRGNAEVCGLWNANKYSAKGLPTILAFAAVSLANQIGLQTLVCLVAHYTLRHAIKAGFTIMEQLGDGGTFTYPIPSIKAIAMVIPDVIGLSSTVSPFRQQLLSLRLRPDQQRVQVLGGEVTRLHYQLCIGGRLVDLGAYRSIEEDRTIYGATA
jgi:hypothetical protein